MKIFHILQVCLLGVTLPSWALTNGPSMPEYNDFESVDNTDLVNLATGDFSYSIPVMTVPGPALGFPINLSYHAGIMPKQEATWVGLGWNLQAGAITRQVNNIPDDFDGDLVFGRLDTHGKKIHGWMASIGYNGVTVGVSHDSENGTGGMIGYSYGGTYGGIGVTTGVNGVYEGVGVSAGLGASTNVAGSAGVGASLSVGIHSKRGATIGIGVGLSVAGERSLTGHATSASLANVGVSLNSQGGASVGASVAGVAQHSSNVTASVSQNSSAGFLPIPTPWGYFEINWGTWQAKFDGLDEEEYYGFLNAYKVTKACENLACNVPKKIEFASFDGFLKVEKAYQNDAVRIPEGSAISATTTEDVYSVASQGISGVFKPYKAENGSYYSFRAFAKEKYTKDCKSFWGETFGAQCDRSKNYPVQDWLEDGKGDNTYWSRDLWEEERTKNWKQEGQKGIIWRYVTDAGGGIHFDSFHEKLSVAENKLALGEQPSQKIKPFYKNDRIQGWIITKADGVRYLYTKTQMNYTEFKISSTREDLFRDYTEQGTPQYAYAWLLTGILSADYVKLNTDECSQYDNGSICLPSGGDLGGWVRFDYSEDALYSWESSVGKKSEAVGFNSKMEPTLYSKTYGIKSISYLEKITTPTHEALMYTSTRLDGRPSAVNKNVEIFINPNKVETDIRRTSNCAGLPGSLSKMIVDEALHDVETNLPNALAYNAVLEGVDSNNYSCLDARGSHSSEDITAQFKQKENGFEMLAPLREVDRVKLIMNLNQGNTSLKRLDSIVLKNTVLNENIEKISFDYDYSLATNTPNSIAPVAEGALLGNGRLTLKSIRNQYFDKTLSSSWVSLPKYQFAYDNNYGFANQERLDEYDRWGFHCSSCSVGKRNSDGTANAWNLKQIIQPSGSKLMIEYEPKAFSYVGRDKLSVEYDSHKRDIDKLYSESNIRTEWDWQNAHFKGKYYSIIDSYNNPNWSQINIQTNSSFRGVDKYFLYGEDMYVPDHDIFLNFSETFFMGNSTGQQVADEDKEDADREDNLAKRMFGAYFYNSNFFSFQTTSYSDDTKKLYIVPNAIDINVNSKNALVGGIWGEDPAVTYPGGFVYGGGVRTKKITFIEEQGSTSKKYIYYSYAKAATPTLPQSFSNATRGVGNEENGAEAFLGSPHVLHGEVGVKVVSETTPGALKQLSSEKYYFYNSAILPVEIGFYNLDKYSLRNNDYIGYTYINDYSAFWGALYKKESFSFDETKILDEEHFFATQTSPSYENIWPSKRWGVTYDYALYSPDHIEEFRSIRRYIGGYLHDDVHGLNANDDNEGKSFGRIDKTFHHRYMDRDCLTYSDPQYCVQLASVQIHNTRVFRYLPYKVKSEKTQDDVTMITRYSEFDILTGTPLETSTENSNGDIKKSMVIPAYKQYARMLSRNMLMQTYGTLEYYNNVLTAAYYDIWRPVNPATGTYGNSYSGVLGSPYRKVTSYSLRKNNNTAATAEPLDDKCFENGSAGVDCSFSNPSSFLEYEQGNITTLFDGFGHTLEAQTAEGVFYTQKYSYGYSLPIAVTKNAKHKEVYYTSFEDSSIASDEYERTNGDISTNFAYSGNRSYYLTGENFSNVNFGKLSLIAGKKYILSFRYLDQDDVSFSVSVGYGSCGQQYLFNSAGSANSNNIVHWQNAEYLPANSGEWKYVEFEVERFSTCSDGVNLFFFAKQELYIDEVRLHPKDALMTTMQYNARGQMISAVNEQGIVNRYIYDSFGNLSGVRNEDGHILSEQNKQFGGE